VTGRVIVTISNPQLQLATTVYRVTISPNENYESLTECAYLTAARPFVRFQVYPEVICEADETNGVHNCHEMGGKEN
jgi:hypothetical protein